MKKIGLLILAVVLIVSSVFVLSFHLSAAPAHCNAGYAACLNVAGNDKSALDGCLRGWAACSEIYLR